MKKSKFFQILILLLAVACTDIDPDIKMGSERELSLTTKQLGFVNAGRSFDFSLIRMMSEKEEADWVISPFGVQVLLGMILNGAEGETAEQINNVLGYDHQDIGEVNDYFRSLFQQMPEVDSKVQLKTANAVFANKGYDIKPKFTSYARNYYLADVMNLDFSKSSSLKTINDWCSEHTDGLVPKMLDGFTMNDMANDIVWLLNAIYFKGEWKNKFNKKDTSDETFHLESGATKSIPMMKNTIPLTFGSFTDDGAMVQVPFGKGSFALTVIMPENGTTLNELVNKLDDDTQDCWTRFMKKAGSYTVDLWLPRICISTNVDYEDILSYLGMPLVFSSNAELFSISECNPYIRSFSQKVVLNLDEEGVRAASASFVRVGAGDVPKNVAFHADRPFLYLISELSSGIILFAGKYTGQNKL